MVILHTLIYSVLERIRMVQIYRPLVQFPILQKNAPLQSGKLVRNLYNVFGRKRAAQFMHDSAHLRTGLMRGSDIHSLRKIATPFNMEISGTFDVIRMSHVSALAVFDRIVKNNEYPRSRRKLTFLISSFLRARELAVLTCDLHAATTRA